MAILILLIIAAAVLAYVTRDKGRGGAPMFRDPDLVRVVLGLGQNELDELLELYREQFGPEAAKYARRTYLKWKSGQVRPNRQTFNRFLVHLPKVMSFDLKCEVLRKLRQEYCSKDDYKLTVNADDWKDALAPLVANVIDKAYTAELPKHLRERLTWLADNDAQIAQAILAESQAQESRNAVALLEREVSNLERLLVTAGAAGKVTHTIKLPYGTITLKMKRR